MQLDRLALHLRRRGSWEAIDLGCGMARQWWRPLILAWLSVYVPCALLLYAALYAYPFAALLVLWWLKPVFDRVALEVLARAVFGDVPRPLAALHALRRSPGILASLTIRRFDLARSFTLPVWHLERLTGREARERLQTLQRRGRGHAVWLTIVFFHFEAILTFAFFGAIDFFTPAGQDLDFGLGSLFSGETSSATWRHALGAALQVTTVALLEPFYVAAGFALYLNRRTQLEAWDVELALRRIAAAAAAVVLAIVCVFPERSAAAERAEPQRAIREVLAQPEFEQYRDDRHLRFRGRSDPAPQASNDAGGIVPLVAEVARALMWLAAAAAVAVLLVYARRYVHAWSPEGAPRASPPRVLFGLDLTPESLPPDVAAAALAAVDAGRTRDALGLLYRGALSVLVNRDAVTLAAGDTEADCVRRVSARGDAEKAQAFAAVVAAWQAAAYARRAPAGDDVRTLCAVWDAHFGAGRSA